MFHFRLERREGGDGGRSGGVCGGVRGAAGGGGRRQGRQGRQGGRAGREAGQAGRQGVNIEGNPYYRRKSLAIKGNPLLSGRQEAGREGAGGGDPFADGDAPLGGQHQVEAGPEVLYLVWYNMI